MARVGAEYHVSDTIVHKPLAAHVVGTGRHERSRTGWNDQGRASPQRRLRDFGAPAHHPSCRRGLGRCSQPFRLRRHRRYRHVRRDLRDHPARLRGVADGARADPAGLEQGPGADRAGLAFDHRQLRQRCLLLHQPDAPAPGRLHAREGGRPARRRGLLQQQGPGRPRRQLRNSRTARCSTSSRARRRPAAPTKASCSRSCLASSVSASLGCSRPPRASDI